MKAWRAVFVGTPEEAWSAAADLSAQVHVRYVDQPYRQVLSVMPEMYDEIWVGAKGMYKMEPVVADGGELIIYAPHINEISVVHGALIRQIGYHVRDYFVKQWDQFKHFPWGVLAHSTHLRGMGTYEDGDRTSAHPGDAGDRHPGRRVPRRQSGLSRSGDDRSASVAAGSQSRSVGGAARR